MLRNTSAYREAGRGTGAALTQLTDGSLPSGFELVRDLIRSTNVPPAKLLELIRSKDATGEAVQALSHMFLASKHLPALIKSLSSIRGASKVSVSIKDSPPPAVVPLVRRPLPLDLARAIVVTKLSKLEYDMRRLGLNRSELLAEYRRGGEDIERIFGSHDRQEAARQLLREALPKTRVISRDQLTASDAKTASLVIALGGDNHFQYVSHFVQGLTPIVGVNSDSKLSFGACLQCSAEDFPSFARDLERGRYRFDPFCRLRTEVDGKRLPPATDTIFLGEQERKYMSRHTLRLSGPLLKKTKPIEQKCSGLLVVTGCGSSGWYKSAGRSIYPEGNTFPPTARYCRFLLTEASKSLPSLRHGKHAPIIAEGALLEGQRLIIQSLNDSNGIITCDSLEELPFPRAATAIIEIEPSPLWVASPL